jgi:hypothetical protein
MRYPTIRYAYAAGSGIADWLENAAGALVKEASNSTRNGAMPVIVV